MDARALREQYTEDIIKYNFANDMGLNMATFPDSYANKALVAMAFADAKLAIARHLIEESLEHIEEAERLAPTLITLTKADTIAGPNLTTHINSLKQWSSTARKAETDIQKLIDEKVPQFKKALNEISDAPKNTNMTPVTIERQKTSLKSIQEQYKDAQTLSKQISDSWTVIIEYSKELQALPSQTRARKGDAAAPKPSSNA